MAAVGKWFNFVNSAFCAYRTLVLIAANVGSPPCQDVGAERCEWLLMGVESKIANDRLGAQSGRPSMPPVAVRADLASIKDCKCADSILILVGSRSGFRLAPLSGGLLALISAGRYFAMFASGYLCAG